ncbi:MAG: sulfite exporter TauE/SafE family protein [Lentisphaerae bacterium]|nr:sulfite exporter TauE/SafE family protein [Lentisphaerota bacterium]
MDATAFSVADWTMLLIAAFLQGISKGGVPGVTILAIPMVAQVIPGKASTGLILPMLLLGDLFALAYWRRSASWRDLLRALPWALVGVILGALFLDRLDDRYMRPVIAFTILFILIIHVWRNYLSPRRNTAPEGNHPVKRHAFAALMGSMGGFTTMVANAAGPVMAMYFLALRLSKATFLGTSAWYFFMVNWVKVPFMIHLKMITVESLRVNAMMAPILVLGVVSGVFIARRLNQRAFDIVVTTLTAIACARLLIY